MSTPAAEPFWEIARARLDALLELEIRRLRARYQLSLDEQRGLYISDAQVDRLLRETPADAGGVDAPGLAARAASLAEAASSALALSPRWTHLATSFALGAFELDVVILAVASELDRKYQTICAYLNDDVSRRYPTRDLVLRLFARGGCGDPVARAALARGATLLRESLVAPPAGTAAPESWVAAGLVASDALVEFLVGSPTPTGGACRCYRTSRPATSWDESGAPVASRERLRRLPLLRGSPTVLLRGRAGSGRTRAVAALAAELGVPLLTIDARLARAGSLVELFRLARLHQRLYRAVLYVTGGEALLAPDGAHASERAAVLALVADAPGLVLVSLSADERGAAPFAAARHVSIDFAEPDARQRLHEWRARAPRAVAAAADALPAIAERFALTRGEIERASATAHDGWTLAGRNGAGPDVDALFAAARDEARGALSSLGPLATRTSTSLRWSDLVLPAVTIAALREVTDAIRHRTTVFDDWGMASRNSGARGLRILLSGPSGTGKSSCAAIVANVELGVDLFTVDLSAITSKYIGETEKHLDRVFEAAKSSSALLFFDEADALFGKRTEVKDAHDRYANVEVAYLLQKIDRYDGTVLLATNLANNLDLGFSRRMHYTIDFPMPGEADRERIWRAMFPPGVPLAADVDFAFLARQFAIAGGDIRNVALNAAFRAAAGGRALGMRELVHAMGRQLVKQGRSPSIAEFREYFPLLAESV